jgi:hypothetical protein
VLLKYSSAFNRLALLIVEYVKLLYFKNFSLIVLVVPKIEAIDLCNLSFL